MRIIDTTSGDYDYTYLSLGAGVQSSALLVLSCTDDRIPKPDVAIFADTGDEPIWVYDYIKVLAEWASAYDIEIVTASSPKGRLSDWVLNRQNDGKHFVTVPVHTVDDTGTHGILRRQCTREFKIAPITQKVRELLGYEPRQRVKETVRAMLGISFDEVSRMKESWFHWVTNCFPLVDFGIKRQDCIKIVTDAGLPEPQKSACVYCPYHSDAYWQWMKLTHPTEFNKAVEFDESIRNMTMKGTAQPGYVHRSCVPLKEAVFSATDPLQLDMLGECEGMCGV